jgi:hypothetical protein
MSIPESLAALYLRYWFDWCDRAGHNEGIAIALAADIANPSCAAISAWRVSVSSLKLDTSAP